MNKELIELRILIDSLPDAAFILEDRIFVDCNKAALNLLRCEDKKHIVGKSPLDLSPPKQYDGISSITKGEELFKMILNKKNQQI